MTEFLIDTNVISELAPGKGLAGPDLLAWLTEREDALYLSVVTPVELKAGILKMGRTAPGRRQRAIEAWYGMLETDFADRILPLTLDVAAHVARIADRNAEAGVEPGWPDTVIAATAAFHNLTLLTRNIRDFAAAGIPVVDPFITIPEA